MAKKKSMVKKKSVPTQLGKYISEQLEKIPMTQIELADRSGIPDATIGRIRSGSVREARASQIARIAKGLRKDFWEVMLYAGFPAYAGAENAEVLRIASIVEGDPDLKLLMRQLLDLDLRDRQSVADLVQALWRRRQSP